MLKQSHTYKTSWHHSDFLGMILFTIQVDHRKIFDYFILFYNTITAQVPAFSKPHDHE